MITVIAVHEDQSLGFVQLNDEQVIKFYAFLRELVGRDELLKGSYP